MVETRTRGNKTMINLFENYNAQAFDLEHSLRQAGFTHTTIVLEENGFMPEHVQTPVGYFTGMQKNHQLDADARPDLKSSSSIVSKR